MRTAVALGCVLVLTSCSVLPGATSGPINPSWAAKTKAQAAQKQPGLRYTDEPCLTAAEVRLGSVTFAAKKSAMMYAYTNPRQAESTESPPAAGYQYRCHFQDPANPVPKGAMVTLDYFKLETHAQLADLADGMGLGHRGEVKDRGGVKVDVAVTPGQYGAMVLDAKGKQAVRLEVYGRNARVSADEMADEVVRLAKG